MKSKYSSRILSRTGLVILQVMYSSKRWKGTRQARGWFPLLTGNMSETKTSSKFLSMELSSGGRGATPEYWCNQLCLIGSNTRRATAILDVVELPLRELAPGIVNISHRLITRDLTCSAIDALTHSLPIWRQMMSLAKWFQYAHRTSYDLLLQFPLFMQSKTEQRFQNEYCWPAKLLRETILGSNFHQRYNMLWQGKG